MKYNKFTIRNYRAIEDPMEINIKKNKLVPLIGTSESGKTTILQAIFAFDYANDKEQENFMNTDNLRTFLQGDGIWILTAIAVLLAIKAWRNSSWLQLFSVVGFYAVIVSIAKGQDILKAVGWFLRLFGIESGL